MSVLKPRKRLIYFRISDEEFNTFNRLCSSEGARSLSDLARSALQRIVDKNSQEQDDALAERLNRLDEMLSQLSSKLQQLDAIIPASRNGSKA